jgi:hypothetical protein
MRGALAVVCALVVFSAEASLNAQSLVPPPSPDVSASSGGIWIDRSAISSLPTRGAAWNGLIHAADRACGTPKLDDQNDDSNVCTMAKALAFARTGDMRYGNDVRAALRSIAMAPPYRGRALSLGRELVAYVIAADVVDLGRLDPELDSLFRARITQLLTTPTSDGPRNLVECHERRPNNWGNHCGASRAAVAAYLGDRRELARVAQVFKGYLGDRASYAGFRYGDLAWQCNPRSPVGINPKGCVVGGRSLDGVLPDDQRRSGDVRWPPPHENYVYEGLQGALVQAVILQRAGFDAFDWGDQALLRAVRWLYDTAHFHPVGDDTWIPHVVNYFYGSDFPAPESIRAGKNVGWTNWTHHRQPSGSAAASRRLTP